MTTYSFDAILELVEEMSDDEQITLIDLIKKRRTEKRRDEIALNIARANEEYSRGQVFRGTLPFRRVIGMQLVGFPCDRVRLDILANLLE
jgi:hypothetical protein